MEHDDPHSLQVTGTGFGAGCVLGTLLILLLVGGASAVALVASTGSLVALIGVIVGLVIAAVLSSPLIIATLTRGGIRLSAAGIVTSGPLMQRTIGWDEVTAIEVLKTGQGRVACVRLRDGTHRQLAAPRDIRPRPDPDFDQKLLTIHRWWESHRVG